MYAMVGILILMQLIKKFLAFMEQRFHKRPPWDSILSLLYFLYSRQAKESELEILRDIS
jgi:hypothetical protein